MWLLWPMAQAAAANIAVPVDVSADEVDLMPWVRVVADPQRNRTVEAVVSETQSMPPRGTDGVLSFGFSRVPRWFVVPIMNDSAVPLQRLLVFEPTWIDDLQVTLIDSQGRRHTWAGGDVRPFDSRSVDHRNPNVQLELPPGPATLVVRVATRDPFYVGMRLFDRARFHAEDSREGVYFGLLYGALLSLLLYNFVLFLSARDRNHLAYSAYLTGFLLAHVAYSGHLFPWLFAGRPEWSNWATSLFIHLYCLAGFVFVMVFLHLREEMPLGYRWVRFSIRAMGASFVLTALVGGYGLQVMTSILWIVVYSVLAMVLGVVALLRRNHAATFYLSASVAGLSGSTISALTVMGVLPYSFLAFRAVDLGMLVDAVMLSLALAERITQVNRLERLRRFFSPAVADQLLAARNEDLYRPHSREIVVLFLDLRGYTRFTREHGPDEVMAMLARFHAVMGELIAAHGATLERFAGDGMMIFFNDPVEVPDPALRACRMAMEMQVRFRELQADWETQGYVLALGVGIAQGVATIGAIGFEGRRDYAAIGNVTNLASRLCSQAQGGQILVCNTVASHAGGLFPCEPLPPMPLKGFADPVVCFDMKPLQPAV